MTALLAKATTANVFELDPRFLAGLPREVAADVVQRGEVEIIRTSSGIVDLDMHRQGGFGLLVLEGFLCRFAEVAGRESVELLGKGDMLLPWADDRAEAPVPVRSSHRVLVPAAFAVLDRQFARRVAPWPTIAETICARLVERARWLALQLALTRVRRIEDRLHVLLWHLADRWGKVRRDGTIVCSVPLTHALLAAMVGAQRPTVTSAMVCLVEEGRVSRHSEGWVLHGEPPTARDIESRTLSAAFRLRPQE